MACVFVEKLDFKKLKLKKKCHDGKHWRIHLKKKAKKKQPAYPREEGGVEPGQLPVNHMITSKELF